MDHPPDFELVTAALETLGVNALSELPHMSMDGFLRHGLEPHAAGAGTDCPICYLPMSPYPEPTDNQVLASPTGSSPSSSASALALTPTSSDDDNDLSGAWLMPQQLKQPTTTQVEKLVDEIRTSFAELAPGACTTYPVRIRHCGHVFGFDCFMAWLRSCVSNRCPICNQHLFPGPHLRLHLPAVTPRRQEAFAKFLERFFGRREDAHEVRQDWRGERTRELMTEMVVGMFGERGIELTIVHKQQSGHEESEEKGAEET